MVRKKNSVVHPYELIHELLFQVACKNRSLTQKQTPRDISTPILPDPQPFQIALLNQLLGLIAVETQPPPPKNAIYSPKYNFYTTWLTKGEGKKSLLIKHNKSKLEEVTLKPNPHLDSQLTNLNSTSNQDKINSQET